MTDLLGWDGQRLPRSTYPEPYSKEGLDPPRRILFGVDETPASREGRGTTSRRLREEQSRNSEGATMGGGENKLTGPDLAHGVRVAEIEDGKPLLGHANGEAVLVARVGTEVFAIGASCTHYGGPLAEGLITGVEIRCPWHHACFDLRTGVARRAPALNPVACYAVTIGDGVARVGAKREREPLAPERSAPLPRAASELASVVVIGAGAAGTAAAEMLRRQGY